MGDIRTVRDLVESQAALRAGAPFLLVPDTGLVVTFVALRDGARRVAGWLGGLGLAPGDRVAMLLPNGPLLVELLLGAQYGGFVPVTLSALASPAHAAAVVEHSEARVVVVWGDDPGAALAAELAAASAVVIRVDAGAAGWAGDGLTGAIPAPVGPDAAAIVAYTSGTTGRPKGVLCSQASVLAGADNVRRAHGLGPGDRALCVLPLSQRGPQNSTLMATLASGGSLVLPPRFDVTRYWALVVGHGCTWLPLVPTLVAELLSRPGPPVDPGDLRHVRFARSSAAALGTAAEGEFEARFGVPLLQCMGSTEAGSNIFSTPLPPAPRKPGSPGISVGFEVRVVDEAGRSLPAGEVGELAIRGPSVMTGYFKDPAATAAVLAPDGWLRLGDLGYLDGDGYAFVVGRIQEFVNKGGVRVALAEIDEALGRHPAVLEAAAVAVPDAYLGEEIAAFVVLRPDASVAPESLLDHCERVLGEFRSPAWVEAVGDLPRGPGGKVERRRLAEAARRPAERAGVPGVADDDLERVVAEVWHEVGLAPAGPRDDFFALGGYSLLALRVLTRLRRRLGVDVPVQWLFEAPTVAGLASRIAALPVTTDTAPVPVPRDRPLPLAPAQERIWRADAAATAPVLTVDVELRGPLDVPALERALNGLVRRHEILRTAYVETGGEPAQVARPGMIAPLETLDVGADPHPARAADRVTREEAARGLDLQRGLVFRPVLLRLEPARHRLVLYLHHVAADRRSVEVLFAELEALYASARGVGPAPPEPALQYADYAVWQRRRLSPEGALHRRQLDYWTTRLSPPPPPLDLPFPRRDPARARPDEGFHGVPYSRQLGARVAALSRREGTTPYVTWLAGFAALVHTLTGCRDVLVGTHASVRDRVELDGLMGNFLNCVYLRIAVEPALPFRTLLARTRAEATRAYGQADVTLDDVAAALRAAGEAVPEPRVMFQYAEGEDRLQLRLAGLEVTRLPVVVAGMPWGLTITPKHRGVVEALWDPRLYDPAGVRAMLGQLVALLDRATAAPDLAVAALGPGRRVARPREALAATSWLQRFARVAWHRGAP